MRSCRDRNISTEASLHRRSASVPAGSQRYRMFADEYTTRYPLGDTLSSSSTKAIATEPYECHRFSSSDCDAPHLSFTETNNSNAGLYNPLEERQLPAAPPPTPAPASPKEIIGIVRSPGSIHLGPPSVGSTSSMRSLMNTCTAPESEDSFLPNILGRN